MTNLPTRIERAQPIAATVCHEAKPRALQAMKPETIAALEEVAARTALAVRAIEAEGRK